MLVWSTCTPVYHVGVSTCYIVFTTSSHQVQDVPSHSAGPYRDVKGKGKMTRVSSPPVMPPAVLPKQHTPSLGPGLHSQSMVCMYIGFVYCFVVYCICFPTIHSSPHHLIPWKHCTSQSLKQWDLVHFSQWNLVHISQWDLVYVSKWDLVYVSKWDLVYVSKWNLIY